MTEHQLVWMFFSLSSLMKLITLWVLTRTFECSINILVLSIDCFMYPQSDCWWRKYGKQKAERIATVCHQGLLLWHLPTRKIRRNERHQFDKVNSFIIDLSAFRNSEVQNYFGFGSISVCIFFFSVRDNMKIVKYHGIVAGPELERCIHNYG